MTQQDYKPGSRAHFDDMERRLSAVERKLISNLPWILRLHEEVRQEISRLEKELPDAT